MLLNRQIGRSKLHAGLGAAVAVLILVMSTLPAKGASSIAQGFKADDPNIVAGALVSLKSKDANTIELASTSNIDRLLGVMGDDSLIELSNDNSTIQVVTSGEAPALVSDINGKVHTGDKITASPIAGVGMKALTSTLIIGTAQADLESAQTETRTISDKNGKKQSVAIGVIPIQVDKVFYEAPQDENSFVPPVLQDFAATIAGRQVSPVRVLIAGMLVLLLFVVITILLYSSVRSSIISIGRNPLSESAVRKSLLQVGITVVGVMVFTTIVIYLILTT